MGVKGNNNFVEINGLKLEPACINYLVALQCDHQDENLINNHGIEFALMQVREVKNFIIQNWEGIDSPDSMTLDTLSSLGEIEAIIECLRAPIKKEVSNERE